MKNAVSMLPTFHHCRVSTGADGVGKVRGIKTRLTGWVIYSVPRVVVTQGSAQKSIPPPSRGSSWNIFGELARSLMNTLRNSRSRTRRTTVGLEVKCKLTAARFSRNREGWEILWRPSGEQKPWRGWGEKKVINFNILGPRPGECALGARSWRTCLRRFKPIWTVINSVVGVILISHWRMFLI